MSKYIYLSGEQELDHNSSPLCKGYHISKQPEFQSLSKHIFLNFFQNPKLKYLQLQFYVVKISNVFIAGLKAKKPSGAIRRI